MTPAATQNPGALSPAPLSYNVYGTTAYTQAAVINEFSALGVPAFYSCTRYLSETLAGMTKSVYQQSGHICQPVTTHPLNKVLQRKPNNIAIPFEFWKQLYHHAIIFGNGYAWIKRDNAGNVLSMFVIDPTRVTPYRLLDNETGEIAQWYFIIGAGKDGKGQSVPFEDMLHIYGPSFDGMWGYPMVWLLAEAIDYARNLHRYSAKYLKKGTQIIGSIEIPKKVDDATVASIRRQVATLHTGIDSDPGPLILTDGGKLNNTTLSPEDSQLIEQMQASNLDICRIFRVSPIKIYEYGRATWNNSEAMTREDIKSSLDPWIIPAEEQLTAKTLTDSEQNSGLYIEFCREELVPMTAVERSTMVVAQVNAGVKTPNEGRSDLNLPPITDPEADELRLPPGSAPPEAGTDMPTAGKPPAKADGTPSSGNTDGGNSGSAYAALKPLIDDAIKRVETKTDKAFAAKDGKPDADKAVWSNVFAQEQSKYVREALNAANDALTLLNGKGIDLKAVGEKYAFSIRSRCAGSEYKPLSEIVYSSLTGGTNGTD